MRFRKLAALLGIAAAPMLGVAPGMNPTAEASPVDDAWPYPGFGFSDTISFAPNYLCNPFLQFVLMTCAGDWIHEPGMPDQYSTHVSAFVVPLLFQHTREEVFASAGAYPAVGAVSDELHVPALIGLPLLTNYFISDPAIGFGDRLILFGIQNDFIFDAAGVRDVLQLFGQDFTLFDVAFPAMPAADGASDLAALLDAAMASG